jgi:glycosyltransferase involved in cell wall biosynthesis
MSDKRILLVSPFPPSLGGVSISVQRLYDFLQKSGYPVSRFNTHFANRTLNRSKALKFIKYLLLPVYLMLNRRFDVIHFHVSGVFPKLYVALWRNFFSSKTKFIITTHGQVSHLLASRLGQYSLSKFDRIICVREGDHDHMPSYLQPRTVEIPAFIPPVISNGSRGFVPPHVENFLLRDTFKMLVNGFVIINEKFKDLYGLKDSVLLLEQLLKLGKSTDLIIIVLGYPYSAEAEQYLRSLKEYAAEKKLTENICWVENTPMDLWPLLKRVHVFLRPTKSDGDALSVRESLWLKIPAISSDAVPRPEGTVVYNLDSQKDFLDKAVQIIDNYNETVSGIGNSAGGFANEIIRQYETN